LRATALLLDLRRFVYYIEEKSWGGEIPDARRQEAGMRWNITTRTIAGFLLMAGLLAGVNLAMIYYIDRLQTLTVTILDSNVSSLLDAVRMQEAIQVQRRRTANFLLTGDEGWVEQLLKDRERFTAIRQRVENTVRTPEERAALTRIEALYEGFLQAQEEATSSYRQGKMALARDMLVGASRQQTESLLVACEEFSRLNERAIEAARAQMLQDNARARRTIYGIAVAGVIIGGLLGVVIARSVVRPLAELVLRVRSAGDAGEVVERLEVSEGQELESLGQGVESLVQKIRSVSADLAQSERMLIQAEKLAMAGQLATGLAHEIRNPLAAIKTMIFALREDLPPDDPRRVDFDVMSGELDQVDRSIQRLLHFARPPNPVFAPVRLDRPLTHAAALLASKAQSQGVQVEVSADPDIVIRADQRQLEQVFVNLILNALQAMPEGGMIRIKTEVRDQGSEEAGVRGQGSGVGENKSRDKKGGEREVATTPDPRSLEVGDGRWAEVEVSDTGYGIPEELLERIFEPFVTGRERGTGLGLSIVRKVVEQHGGRIAARNRPEGGAAFTILFPLEEDSRV
jgi:signal transduction histidine kinase